MHCKKYCLLITLIISSFVGHTQQNDLDVGTEFPNVKIHNITNFYKKEIDIKELRGKWTIIDFWSPNCGTCVTSFPQLNEIQDHFENKVNILLIANDNGEMVRKTYNRFSKKYNSDLPIAYDTDLFWMANVPYVPYYIVLDPNGIIRVKLDFLDLTIENLEKLMTGQEFKIISKFSDEEFDTSKPILTNGNGGEDTSYLYRSLLTNWKLEIPAYGVTHISAQYGNMIQILGYPLKSFYFLAYQDTLFPYPVGYDSKMKSAYGTFWLEPVLEVSDSSEFMWTPGIAKNFYCYSLSVPKEKATSLLLQKTMQRDLKGYFGYKVSVESRMMPCWYLVATEKANRMLPTKADETLYKDYNFVGFEFKNIPITELIFKLWANFQREPPFFDATGIVENIDIKIDTDMTDFQSVRSALREYGLELKRGTREFKVIVIKDKDAI